MKACFPVATNGEEFRLARTFSYFDDWRRQELRCDCGWCGPLHLDQAEPHESLMEFCCPECDTSLVIVTYPTDDEAFKRLDELPRSERASVLKRQQFLEEAGRLSLQHPEQLPALEDDELELQWDFLTEGETRFTIIRHGATVVWRELAFWEGTERFEEVAMILKARYGSRLLDLVPTEASYLYLYGDELSAPSTVKQVRKSLRELQ